MRDIAMVIPCWKSPELLEICIPSLLRSITTDSEVIVVLNEADDRSKLILDELKVKHIDRVDNNGPSAVDYAIPYIKEQNFKYVSNINSDMVFQVGWDKIVIDTLEKNKPCTVSLTLVEPVNNGIHVVFDNLGVFTSPTISERFNDKLKSYKSYDAVYYSHPITCLTKDYLAVNGYSDNMNQIWIDVKGRGLDDDFPFRLLKLDPNYKFIRSGKAFVYHGISLNSNKLATRTPGGEVFFNKNKESMSTFRHKINIGGKL